MKKSLVVLLLFVLLGCGGGGLQQPVTAETAHGEQTITVKASDYKFEPNNIRARKGEAIVFRIENITKKKHNFTLKDTKGNTLQNVDIPPAENVSVAVNPSEPGIYEFYCDEPFHSAFGMKGRLEVSD